MRRAAFVGTMITFAALVFGLMQVAAVGATSASLPVLQETATATTDADTTATADVDTTATAGTTATVDADTTATTGTTATSDADTTATTGTTATTDAVATAGTTATADADTTATVATTATAGSTTTADTTAPSTSQGQLPDTGGSNSPTLTLLVIGTVLFVFGAFAVSSLFAKRRDA